MLGKICADVAALRGDIFCLADKVHQLFPGVLDCFEAVIYLLYTRRVDSVPAVAGYDVAYDVGQLFASEHDAAEAADHVEDHLLYRALRRQFALVVAVILALLLPQIYEEVHGLAPRGIEEEGEDRRTYRDTCGALCLGVGSDALVILRLAYLLPYGVIGLRAVGLEHGERAKNQVVRLSYFRVVQRVGHGLAARNGVVEFPRDLFVEGAVACAYLLRRAYGKLRLLPLDLVLGPGPERACRPAVHTGNSPAAEDGAEKAVSLRPVGMVLELLGLWCGIPHEPPVELRGVFADEFPVNLRELREARNILNAQIRPAHWDAAELLDYYARIRAEDGGNVV